MRLIITKFYQYSPVKFNLRIIGLVGAVSILVFISSFFLIPPTYRGSEEFWIADVNKVAYYSIRFIIFLVWIWYGKITQFTKKQFLQGVLPIILILIIPLIIAILTPADVSWSNQLIQGFRLFSYEFVVDAILYILGVFTGQQLTRQ